MRLRLATSNDLAALAVLARQMHAESSHAAMHFSVDCVKATLGALIDKCQFVAVAEVTTGAGAVEIVGAMAGTVQQSWFGEDMVAHDVGLFVVPGRRGGVVAMRLVRAFVMWARMAGARQIRPGVNTGCDAAVRLYDGLGFRRCGATFVMEV